jgi:hypothetical protein
LALGTSLVGILARLLLGLTGAWLVKGAEELLGLKSTGVLELDVKIETARTDECIIEGLIPVGRSEENATLLGTDTIQGAFAVPEASPSPEEGSTSCPRVIPL